MVKNETPSPSLKLSSPYVSSSRPPLTPSRPHPRPTFPSNVNSPRRGGRGVKVVCSYTSHLKDLSNLPETLYFREQARINLTTTIYLRKIDYEDM